MMSENWDDSMASDYAYDESGGVVASAPKRGYASCLKATDEDPGSDWVENSIKRGTVPGVGPDSPTVTAANGSKQSHVPYRCDLLPAKALLHIANILDAGAKKYGANNWRGVPTEDHINHAMVHLLADQAGDDQDDHVGHAACRMLMALETMFNETK